MYLERPKEWVQPVNAIRTFILVKTWTGNWNCSYVFTFVVGGFLVTCQDDVIKIHREIYELKFVLGNRRENSKKIYTYQWLDFYFLGLSYELLTL